MDIIRYILERVAARLPGLHDCLAQEIEREVRQFWAGDRPYVAKNGDGARSRNRAILRDWRNGERVALIARRYKISRVQVWRIVRREKDVTSLP